MSGWTTKRTLFELHRLLANTYPEGLVTLRRTLTSCYRLRVMSLRQLQRINLYYNANRTVFKYKLYRKYNLRIYDLCSTRIIEIKPMNITQLYVDFLACVSQVTRSKKMQGTEEEGHITLARVLNKHVSFTK